MGIIKFLKLEIEINKPVVLGASATSDSTMMTPIGYMRSPFLFKNGTPRQATVCSQARGVITIEKSVFNNPEHSLEGLEDFTHVWILFIFHQNNNTYTKAKVKPPRLNGKRVGLFSTRSPYRPNNVGLTLAKIESISGATLTVSGIDIIDGTPVIDIKPYIQQYDCPSVVTTNTNIQTSGDGGAIKEGKNVVGVIESNENGTVKDLTEDVTIDREKELILQTYGVDTEIGEDNTKERVAVVGVDSNEITTVNDLGEGVITVMERDLNEDLKTPVSEMQSYENDKSNCGLGMVKCIIGEEDISNDDQRTNSFVEKRNVAKQSSNNSPSNLIENNVTDLEIDQLDNDLSNSADINEDSTSTKKTDRSPVSKSAQWIETPPIQSLTVRFTPSALEQLGKFSLSSQSNDLFKLKLLKSSKDAEDAICNILTADPRSTYRRKHCKDSLYYFTLDTIHVTCWFDESFVEVVRIKPACLVDQCKHKYS